MKGELIKSGGRPSDYPTGNKLKEFLKKVETLAMVGCTDKQICIMIKQSEGTFYLWKRTKPEFKEAIEHGRAKGITGAKAAILTIANSKTDKTSDRLHALMYYLSKYDASTHNSANDQLALAQVGSIKKHDELLALQIEQQKQINAKLKEELEHIKLQNKKLREEFGNSDTEQAITSFLHKLDDSIEDNDGSK